jgi:tetratricopeptide (TPR) repeat protein
VDARARTYLLVAVAAAAVAAFVVATVAFTRTSATANGSSAAQATASARGRAPALVLDLGVRTDPEAVALRRANQLYAAGKRRAAGAIFRRYRSVEAGVGAALAAWPNRTVSQLEQLARRHPDSGIVFLHLGLAQVASGQAGKARAAWRRALSHAPNTEPAVQAESLLYPSYAPGRPPFVPSFTISASVARLSPPRQLAAFARAARRDDVRAKLLYGSALQRLGRSVSAEREFAAAARLATNDPEAQVAAAVGRFSKAHPEDAFSRLGPLAPRYPHVQTVRFHLGELLLWIGRLKQARTELRLAYGEGRLTPLGRTAAEFLKQLS